MIPYGYGTILAPEKVLTWKKNTTTNTVYPYCLCCKKLYFFF